jgi:endo-1,4-beta-D-glucanase Y
MNRTLRILLGAVVAGASVTSAQAIKFPPYPALSGKYNMIPAWDSRLLEVWGGWKSLFLVNGVTQGNDPAGNKRPISEGQSYAMLMAVWMGDQATFNTVWKATEDDFWTGQWYRWKSKNDPQPDNNFAGDADIDICGALIFASALVDAGIWTNHTYGGNTYKAKAVIVLKSIIANFIDKGNNYRINSWPGAGDGIRNPSYHMPQYYPILKEFAAANGVTGMDWDAATKGAFDLLEAQTNANKGMARNFSNGSGGPPGGGTSSPNNYDMGFDAIRVPYRVGIAGIWYPKKFPRAINYAKKVWAAGAVDPNKPGMYRVDNAELFGWGGTTAQYEELMTRAMWGTLATAVLDSSAAGADAYNTIRGFMSANHIKPGLNYLAGANPDTESSTAPRKNYYAQSLGLMGALAMAGRAPNIWDDLKNPWIPPDTATKITSALTATPTTIQVTPSGATPGTVNTTVLSARWNKSVTWTLYFQGRTTGATYQTTATTSNEVSFSWSSNRKNPISKAFGAEVVDVRLKIAGMDTTKGTDFKATLTLSPSTSIQSRKATLAPFVQGGVVLSDRLWNVGERVRTRVLDLAGRELQSSAVSTLGQAQNGVMVSLALPRSLNVRLLEVSDLEGTQHGRYLISPNP